MAKGNKKETKEWDAYLAANKAAEALSNAARDSKDPEIAVREKAGKTLRKLAYDSLDEKARANVANADELDGEVIENTLKVLPMKYRDDVSMAVFGKKPTPENLENFVGQIPKSALEQIVLVSEVSERVKGNKERALVRSYGAVQNLDEIIRRYEEGKASAQDMQIAIKAAASARGRERAEKAKEEGYSSDLQRAVEQLYALFTMRHPSEAVIQEYAPIGLKEARSEAEKAFKKAEKGAGKKVADISREAYLNWVKEARGDERTKAISIPYAAQAGKIKMAPARTETGEED